MDTLLHKNPHTQHSTAPEIITPFTLISSSKARTADTLGPNDSTAEPLLTVSSSTRILRSPPPPPTAISTILAPTVETPSSQAALDECQHQQCSSIRTTDGITITSWEQVLDILWSSPSMEQVSAVLQYLTKSSQGEGQLDIHLPGPTSSQIVKMLVDKIIPHFWGLWRHDQKKRKRRRLSKPGNEDDEGQVKEMEKEEDKLNSEMEVGGLVDKENFVICLRSVLGLGGIMARLSPLAAGGGGGGGGIGERSKELMIKDLLEVLEEVLGRTTVLWDVWKQIYTSQQMDVKKDITWKEFVSLVAAGKILGIAASTSQGLIEDEHGAEDERGAEGKGGHGGHWWVGDSVIYSRWLGKGIAVMAEKLGGYRSAEAGVVEVGWKCLRMMFWRGFGLGRGCWDEIVETTTMDLLLAHPLSPKWSVLGKVLTSSNSHDKSRYITSLLRILSQGYLEPVSLHQGAPDWWFKDQGNVNKVAAVINGVVHLDERFRSQLVDWISGAGGIGEGVGLVRAVLAVIGAWGGIEGGEMKKVLEKSLKNFGDKLWIRHTPIQVQEVNVQVVLLSAGYVHRRSPETLKRIMQTSMYLNGISNRIASLSPRARFLGMVVGEALSSLAYEANLKLDFKMEEMQSEEAKWWKSLVNIVDKVGTLNGLHKIIGVPTGTWRGNKVQSRVVDIKDLQDDMDEDELVIQIVSGDDEKEKPLAHKSDFDISDEFHPYPKPDDDYEDSEDDPTLVNRSKPQPPVYIRDLLRLLRDHDSYEKQLQGLSHAAILIRRKSSFGTELSEHLYELAGVLAGMQDKYDMENFQEMKTQALIALVVADPIRMGQYCARGFFDGEYSIGQRAVLLTVMGMGARELAGYKDEDLPLSEASGKGKDADGLFPSKLLPGKLHELYAPREQGRTLQGLKPGEITTAARRLDVAAAGLEKDLIRPMAAEAADKLSGPNVLKVRTFSSRMEAEKRRGKPQASKLAKVVAEAFFYPLTGRWWVKLKEFGPKSPQFQPYLLSLYLKTLSLILHASGPSTLTLPQMTSELWDLLLSLRHHSSHHSTTVKNSDSATVLEAILFSLLTLLELNLEAPGGEGGKRLVEEHAKRLVETSEWVQLVFERAPGGGSGGMGSMGIGGGKEEDKVRQLAAAVLLRTREVMEAWQRRLMGEMASLE